jgi:hypothetical protein
MVIDRPVTFADCTGSASDKSFPNESFAVGDSFFEPAAERQVSRNGG